MIMQEFNTDAYNTVCMLSSIMGMIGAVYQVNFKEIVRATRHWVFACIDNKFIVTYRYRTSQNTSFFIKLEMNYNLKKLF